MAQFVYGPDGTVPLVPDSNRVQIKFSNTLNPMNREELISSIKRIDTVLLEPTVDRFIVCSLSTGDGYWAFLDSLAGVDGIDMAEPYMRFVDSTLCTYGATFVAAFEPTVTRAQIDSLASLYRATLVRELDGLPNVYTLRNTKASGRRLLEQANLYHELPETRYAHPDILCRIEKHAYTLYDYYSVLQYHSRKVIGQFDTASVWDFAGLDRPVDVAVVDDGIDAHFDLPAGRILAGMDFNPDPVDTNPIDSDPRPGPEQGHGMGCAGIIAAGHSADSSAQYDRHTAIFGINPHALILPVKIFDDDGGSGAMTESKLSNALHYAWNSSEMLSCSWGWSRKPSCCVEDIDTQLMRAYQFGRGGKGCPVVFSSGNAARYPSYIRPVGYPAQLPYVLAVGASTLQDQKWDYSQYGPALDVVAPSGETGYYGDVWTLDQKYDLGVNPNYTGYWKNPIVWSCERYAPGVNDPNVDCRFGGTSAAAPVVSGVVALLLARNDTLNVETIYEIIRHSAVALAPQVPDSLTGWGRVDAFRAILSIARGDVSNDGNIDISDISALVDFLYNSGPPPFPSVLLADVDCDGYEDIADLLALVDNLYINFDPLPLPCFAY